MERNFILKWKESGLIKDNSYKFIASMFSVSEFAIKKYGKKAVANIVFDQDDEIIVLQNINLISNEKTLYKMGFNLICFSADFLLKKGFTRVYSKKKLDFIGLDNIGNLATIRTICSKKQKISDEYNLPRQLRYNINPKECRWPTGLMENKIKDCKFVFSKEYNLNFRNNIIKIVHIPKNSYLYRGEILYDDKNYPVSQNNLPLVWFSASIDHLKNLSDKVLYLQYKTTRDLVLIYEQNISKKYGENVRGFEYIPFFNQLGKYIYKQYNVSIDGYVGCNECEIGIVNNIIEDVINLPPVIVKKVDIKNT